MEPEEVIKRFTYHAPHGNQVERYNMIRLQAKEFGCYICAVTPASREQSLAITALEECVMWANAAIARNEAPGEGIILPDENTLYLDVLTTGEAEGSSSPASESEKQRLAEWSSHSPLWQEWKKQVEASRAEGSSSPAKEE